MHFKVAILSVLATRPNGRATLDELKDEVEALTANADQPDGLAPAFDDINIFQSGLVIPEDGGLRLTDTGRTMLKALQSASAASLDLSTVSHTSHSLKLIDDLIGTEERLKIFDLELRGEEVEPELQRRKTEDAAPAPDPPGAAEQQAEPDPEDQYVVPADPGEAGDFYPNDDEAISTVADASPTTIPSVANVMDTPTFLARDHFRRGVKAGGTAPPLRAPRLQLIGARLQQAGAIWRRHLERDPPNLKPTKRTTNVGGGAIALLTLLVLVICAGAVFALTQIRSLKSEVATLQRELTPLRERAAKADLQEKAKQNAEQQNQFQNKPGPEKTNAPRPEQAPFALTAEEVRLLRDYIKPAPSTGTPGPAINLGDTVNVATIPLPSALMEKIPKLLGARFTTRNGAIVILRRDSRQADIVLPPN